MYADSGMHLWNCRELKGISGHKELKDHKEGQTQLSFPRLGDSSVVFALFVANE